MKRHYRDAGAVAALGRVGFVTKAFVYAGIGWLACLSALSHEQNESPQGVFILIGSQRGPWGDVLLAVTLLGLSSYVCWRFWEGVSGQGYTPRFSTAKNFFQYRLAPLVSGVVYFVYACYVAYLLVEPALHAATSYGAGAASCFPACWRDSAAGVVGLWLLTLAFTIGAVTQLVPAITGSFEQEMDRGKLARYPRPLQRFFHVAGVVGFLARAGLFALVAVYFARLVLGADFDIDPHRSTVAQALNELRANAAGRVLLFTIGSGLVVYGLFALANVALRSFPTRPAVVAGEALRAPGRVQRVGSGRSLPPRGMRPIWRR